MKYSLRLEAIGDDRASYVRAKRRGEAQMDPERERRYLYETRLDWRPPWVAEIVGLRWDGRLERRFLRPNRDYRNANSLGSRGVYFYYLLDEGPIYEVFARTSWKSSERYFLRIVNGQEERIDQEEVLRWLGKLASESTF